MEPLPDEASIAMSTCVFVAETKLPTLKGYYRVLAFKDHITGLEPLAIVHGDIEGKGKVLMRVHDQCFTSEVLGSMKCDCREQLDYALETIKVAGGIVIYLQQEGRGIGIANKIAAYALQEKGYDTVEANAALGLPQDTRDYTCVPYILNTLKVASVCLMTNNPRKIEALTTLGVKLEERVPIIVPSNEHNTHYLKIKGSKMQHMGL